MIIHLRSVIMITALTLILVATMAYATNYLTVNYVTYLNPNGQASDYYIEYTVILYNNKPYPVTYNVTLALPPYSSVIYATEGYNLVGSNITWIVALQPYSDASLTVRIKPVYSVLPIATMQFSELINNTSANSTIISGGVGTVVQLNVNIHNELPYPLLTTISVTRQSGLAYIYNETPTLTQSILGYDIDYWLFNTENTTTMSIGEIVNNLGPWRSVRINPVTVQASVDLNESIESLAMSINELNGTLNQIEKFSTIATNISSISGNYSQEFLQLIALLNQTSQILGDAAYLVNSTLMVQGLLQAQLVELKVALETEGQVLNVEDNVIGQLRSSLEPIVNNEPTITSTLNALKQELEFIESNTNNATLVNSINNAVILINQVENELTIINNLYNNLGTIQSELSSTENQVNTAVTGLNYALAAANESEGLIISISNNLYQLHLELTNVTTQLLITYFKMEGYQASAMRNFAIINNYSSSIEGMIEENEIKMEILKNLANYYTSMLIINGTSNDVDVTVEETFIINMPAVVDTQYLQYLLNETSANVTTTKNVGNTILAINLQSLLIWLSIITVVSTVMVLKIIRRL